jgi:hypothetical protein
LNYSVENIQIVATGATGKRSLPVPLPYLHWQTSLASATQPHVLNRAIEKT